MPLITKKIEDTTDIKGISFPYGERFRPIIITGLFRTGTTYLHNVLAADPESRAARTWELAHPVGRRYGLLTRLDDPRLPRPSDPTNIRK